LSHVSAIFLATFTLNFYELFLYFSVRSVCVSWSPWLKMLQSPRVTADHIERERICSPAYHALSSSAANAMMTPSVVLYRLLRHDELAEIKTLTLPLHRELHLHGPARPSVDYYTTTT